MSVWEIAIKNQLSRHAINVTGRQFAALIAEAGFELLPVTARHALEIENLPNEHGDPFDRLLVATARAETYRLLTHDRALAAYDDHVMAV